MRIAPGLGGGAMLLLASAVAVPARGAADSAAKSQDTLGPPVTGTMYDGNNTKAPQLKLEGPLAPVTEALVSTESFAPSRGQGTQTSGNMGGNSASGRAGGGN